MACLVVEHRSENLGDLQVLLLLNQGKQQLYPWDLSELLSCLALFVSVEYPDSIGTGRVG